MGSKLRQTADIFLGAWGTLSGEQFLKVLAPTAVIEFAPSSIELPGPKGAAGFAEHVDMLKDIMTGFPVSAKRVYENQAANEITIWATSLAQFREELKDDTFTPEEWAYKGEYIYIMTMDETQEKIVRIFEFLDSYNTEKVKLLMARATSNLEKKA